MKILERIKMRAHNLFFQVSDTSMLASYMLILGMIRFYLAKTF